MKYQKGDKFPITNLKNIYNNDIPLYSDNKITLLTFFRFAGCPTCNLRVHKLLEEFSKKNSIKLIGIFESSDKVLQKYLETEDIKMELISDTTSEIYNKLGVERSFFKSTIKALFKGLLVSAVKGLKYYKKKPKIDGNIDRLTADFLINENGIILEANYAEYQGDHLNINIIKSYLN